MNPTRPFTFRKAREDGFTFIELLVVIVTIAILTLLLLPALAGTKPNSQVFQCLENQRQLTLAWRMYAEDNNGKLPPNGDQTTQPAVIAPTDPRILPGGTWLQWCPGNMDAFNPQWTNLIQAGVIYPYVNTMAVYKCPADLSVIKFGPLSFPRPRSYSMNCFMAPIHTWGDGGIIYRNFYKNTDLVQPGPSMTFVFIDESSVSINDTFFIADPGQQQSGQPYWQDVPTTRHGNAGTLSFADGHTEIKGWTDKTVLAANAGTQSKNAFIGDPSSGDAAWLCARATSLIP